MGRSTRVKTNAMKPCYLTVVKNKLFYYTFYFKSTSFLFGHIISKAKLYMKDLKQASFEEFSSSDLAALITPKACVPGTLCSKTGKFAVFSLAPLSHCSNKL